MYHLSLSLCIDLYSVITTMCMCVIHETVRSTAQLAVSCGCTHHLSGVTQNGNVALTVSCRPEGNWMLSSPASCLAEWFVLLVCFYISHTETNRTFCLLHLIRVFVNRFLFLCNSSSRIAVKYKQNTICAVMVWLLSTCPQLFPMSFFSNFHLGVLKRMIRYLVFSFLNIPWLSSSFPLSLSFIFFSASSTPCPPPKTGML